MGLDLLLGGAVLGFALSGPVGPLCILCVNRSLRNGFLSGLLTGMGAATADLIYALIAGLGLTVIFGILSSQIFTIQLVGALYLFYLGAKIYSEKLEEKNAPRSSGLLADYFTGLKLTIANPAQAEQILSFAAGFSGLGLASLGNNYADASLLFGGVVLGSFIWWALLSGMAAAFRDKVKSRVNEINKFSGIIIVILGLVVMLALLIPGKW